MIAAAFVQPAAALEMPQLLLDAETGAVLHAEHAHRPWRPASLTKLMTLYLVFEALDAGALDAGDRLRVSAHAAAQPPTRLGLAAGQEIAVDDAVAALIVRSANDVAVVLAEALAGDEPSFAALMTFRAADLGMSGTRFANASGLPDPGNVTNARDMALLARALLTHFPDRYPLFATTSLSWGGSSLPTYNGLLVSYAGADGMKTGFTCASGYNLVASAVRNGRRLIGVVLGGRNSAERTIAMRRLLDRGFTQDAAIVAEPAAAGLPGLPRLPGLSDLAALEPPVVIPPAECDRNDTAETELVVTGRTAPAQHAGIGGWGMLLGAYPTRKEAGNVAAAAQGRLKSVVSGGKPVFLKRTAAGLTRYTVLLTNVTQQQAAAGCRHLRTAKSYCVALGPQALKNPRARWW